MRAFAARTAFGPHLRMFAATASALAESSAAGTTSCARPMCTASLAPKTSAVR